MKKSSWLENLKVIKLQKKYTASDSDNASLKHTSQPNAAAEPTATTKICQEARIERKPDGSSIHVDIQVQPRVWCRVQRPHHSHTNASKTASKTVNQASLQQPSCHPPKPATHSHTDIDEPQSCIFTLSAQFTHNMRQTHTIYRKI